jgi:uncharacterized repeat protein (TIGR01451 family)
MALHARIFKQALKVVFWTICFFAASCTEILAATCGPATSPGTAPPAWQTYCWIDMTSYNNATVMGAGQAFSISLSDGSVFAFTLKGTSTPTTSGLVAITPPSWTGSAVGNTAFLGIPNKPILYTSAAGTINLTMSAISITPPSGGVGSGQYKIVVADAESTNNGESLTYTTNGGAWTVVDQVNPISGAIYPTTTNTGTVFTETGVAGTVGAFIVGTQSPSSVSVQLVAGGLQGIMFAVQYATISTNKVIVGSRANTADQFTYGARTTSSSLNLAQATSTGAGLGPFGSAVATVATSVPTTIYEQMAAGSVSTLAQYSTSLSCTNANAGSPTVMPTNVAATSYNLAAFAYGDAISCTFTNTPLPATVALKKITLGAAGGAFSFTQTNLATNPPNITTASAGVAAPAAPTAVNVVALNTAVQITEAANATFTLTSATCSDANSALTGNPASFGASSGSVLTIPATNIRAAAQITCTLTNTATAPKITLQKTLSGTGRLNAADQFRLSVTGTGAPAAVNTTGSAAAITSAAINFNATAGSAYVLNETMAAGSVSALTSYIKTASCTNSNAAGTSVSGIISVPINITPAQGDGISCLITNAPAQPNLAIVKTASTASPVSVGQTIVYTYKVTNTGNVAVANVKVSDMHGTPAVLVASGAGGVTNETLTVPGPYGAAASTDSLANDGIWSSLAPGATAQFIYTHTVTQAEIDNG